MNKKLLFLLCIVIHSSSISLFGMESESDEEKEIANKNESVSLLPNPDQQQKKQNQNFDNKNWQSERKNRVEKLNKETKKKQKEKFFEEHDVCIMDGNPYFRPKGKEPWISLKLLPEIHVEFVFDKEQMQKKIDIDRRDYINEKRYFHDKNKKYWFSEDGKVVPESDFDKQINKKQIQEKIVKQPEKQKQSFQEWQALMQKQIEEKELAIKKGLPEPEGQILPNDSVKFDKNQKQEEINNAIKRVQNFQKARNEKTIKQLKKQKEPVDINLKKCETFNPGHAKPLEQNSDSKTNSQKPWIFRNPNSKKQENQNEMNNAVVGKDEIAFKDLENSKPIWVDDPINEKTWGFRSKTRGFTLPLELQPLNKMLREEPYDPDYELKAWKGDDAEPQKQNFDSKEEQLLVAEHGDFNSFNEKQAFDPTAEYWKLLHDANSENQKKENDNFKLLGYEVFNPNNNSQKKGHSWKDQEFEKEHKKFMHQTTEEWKEELAEETRKKAKKDAEERARRAWLRKLEEAKRTGTEQGIVAYAAHRVAAQKPIVDAFHQGAIGGIEHGTATAVASLILMAMQSLVEKGVKWWNQPNSKELAQLAQKMHLQQFLEALQEGIEKNQKSLENISPVVTTIGNNVEKAQQIFEKQLNQKREELIDEIHNNEQVKRTIISDLEARKKQNLAIFKVNLAREREKIIKEFKQQQGISNNPSGEQAKKLEEFLQNLKKDMSQKEQQFIHAQEAELTLEKQQEKYIKKSLDILLQTSPEAKFYAVHDEYTDRALEILQSQRAMMNVATNNVRVGFNGKPSRSSRIAPVA